MNNFKLVRESINDILKPKSHNDLEEYYKKLTYNFINKVPEREFIEFLIEDGLSVELKISNQKI